MPFGYELFGFVGIRDAVEFDIFGKDNYKTIFTLRAEKLPSGESKEEI